MSKVGILSMQRIKNYGSFLQAYALKSIIENLGHSVEFVDYHIEKPIIKNVNESKKLFNKGINALRGDAPLIQKLQYIIHKKNFGKKYFKLLNLSVSPNYNPVLDTLVIGSDEVFNCIQSNTNVGYSLELFGKDNKAKRVITYAASFGNTTIDKIKKYEKLEELSKYINDIDKISVRDVNSELIIKKITHKDVLINLDPVLIFDYFNQENLIPNIKVKKKYILVYAYSGRIKSNESEYIKKIAKEKELQVYTIGGAQRCAEKFIDCSPFEVLSYFKNAEFVITDTFHGSIFSIITQRPFITLVRKSVENSYGNEEKITDLLKRLNLKDRIVYSIYDNEKILNKKIDYENVNKIIEEEKVKTLKYLKDNI